MNRNEVEKTIKKIKKGMGPKAREEENPEKCPTDMQRCE